MEVNFRDGRTIPKVEGDTVNTDVPVSRRKEREEKACMCVHVRKET